MPARGAAQVELSATFRVSGRVEQPQLIASQGTDAAGGAVLSARVPAGWVASVDRQAAGTFARVASGAGLVAGGVALNEPVVEARREATAGTVTWTFVPL